MNLTQKQIAEIFNFKQVAISKIGNARYEKATFKNMTTKSPNRALINEK